MVADKTAQDAQQPEQTAQETAEAVAEPKPETSEEESIEALRQSLKEAEAKAAEYLDGWQRARAELANYRKRVEREQAELTKMANAELIRRLLPVLDDFERAFQTIPNELRKFTWLEGIYLIMHNLQTTLEKEGLEPIEAVGKPFDPLLHEAVMQEETTEFEDGVVMQEFQRGYRLHGRVLRPALVKVAKRVEPSPEEKKEAEAEAEAPAAAQEPVAEAASETPSAQEAATEVASEGSS